MKDKVKGIIEKLTEGTNSVFSHKIYDLAAEFGIGEGHVRSSLEELEEDKFITEPVMGVIKKV
jgi:hypothetical protein